MTIDEIGLILLRKMLESYPNKLDLLAIYFIDAKRFKSHLKEFVECDEDLFEKIVWRLVIGLASGVKKNDIIKYFNEIAHKIWRLASD